MPARKISPKNTKLNAKGKEESEADGLLAPAPGSGPSRRSARQANTKWNIEYAATASTPNKRGAASASASPSPSPSRVKANVGAKRAAPEGAVATPGSAKRVKFDNDEAGDVKVEVAESKTGLLSPNDTDDDDKSSVLSDPAPSEGEDEDEYDGKPLEEEVKSEDDDSNAGEDEDGDFSEEEKPKKTRKKATKGKSQTSTKVKNESPNTLKTQTSRTKSTGSSADKAASLQAKKLKSFAQFSKQSPFPDFSHPTAEEARLAHRILAKLHGERIRPEKVVANPNVAGCGDSPSVLDALVRTILSQNTSDKNSTRAKLSMDKVYGGSDNWDAVLKGGQEKLQEAIKSGGLSVVKSKVIISILEQTKEKYGKFSLDHLFDKSDEEAMEELISFQGVGPKTASCVLLFCLQRESFAVDTHVYRIAGMLGWRPQGASRDETHAHLEVRIPDEDKYGLHILMVGHGKKCDECKSGGKSTGKCELRRAFRTSKLKGEAGEDSKEEEKENIKAEATNEEPSDTDMVKTEEKDEDWETGQIEYVHGMQSGTKQAKVKSKAKAKK